MGGGESVKKVCRSIVLFLALLVLAYPAKAEDVLGLLQEMQRQIQTLRDEVSQKQQQIDLIQNRLEQVISSQESQQLLSTESEPPVVATQATEQAEASGQTQEAIEQVQPEETQTEGQPHTVEHAVVAPTPTRKKTQDSSDQSAQAVSDDEVLFSDGSVFTSEEPQEVWPGWLNTFNINGNLALRFEAGSNQQFNQGFSDTFKLSDFNLDFSFEPTSKLDVNLGLQMQETFVKSPVREGLKINDTKAVKHQFVVKYAFADYTFTDWLRLRFGAFLTPFGVYNESLHSDYDSRLVERPFLSEEIIPAPWTQLGVQLHGDFDLSPAWRLHYAMYMGNGLEAVQDKKGVIKSSRISDMTHQLVSRFNSNRAIGGRLGLLGNDGQHHFELGISSYHGAWDPLATLNLDMLGADIWYHYNGLDLRAEWALARQDIVGGKQYNYGWYTQAAYRWKMFEPVFRFGRLRNRFFNDNGAFIDDRHRFSAGLNLYLGKFFILKMAYSETVFSAVRRHDHRFMSTLTAGF